MSLRAKILLILSLVFVVYAGLDHALQQFVVFRNFRLLEEDGAERDVQRVVQAVGNEVRHGRALDAALVEEVSAQTGIDFDVWPLASADLPAEERALLSSIVDSSGPIVRAAGREMIHAYATLQDAGGAPAMLLRANLPRDITGRGAAAVRYGLLSTVFAGLLLMLVLLALLQRTVIRPIAALTEHAVGIGRGDDPRKRLSLDRADEIGILAREFDGMMDQLARSRAALVETARAAGMSEIATGVLHNVGNALNSVNTSAALISEKTASPASEDLRAALAAVREASGDLATFLARDPRGPHFLPLLDALADQIRDERTALATEVRSLSEGVEHIQSLIQAQQGFAGRAGVLETADLREPVEVALAMTAPGGRPDERIEIVREYGDIPPGPIDRHRLTEILVNLVQNARQAIQAGPPSSPRLTLRIARRGSDRARIEVEDNGVGIAPENLARIFTHGFTTRQGGHGFGLHASANAATEMGGVLSVRSEGAGRGATFVLEIPVASSAPPEVAA